MRRLPPWDVLPKLDGLYPLYELKPGAQVLCEISDGAGGAGLPIVAFHRYGKGFQFRMAVKVLAAVVSRVLAGARP